MKISTFLWFDGHAEAAATHYTSLFADSEIVDVQHGEDGGVMTVTFALAGQRYVAHNGGPQHPFTPAITMFVECGTQREVDSIWESLASGGAPGPGGSLVDRFGVTWQVVPTALQELLRRAEPERAERVLTALHAMTKIDIQGLVDAHDQ